MTDVIVPDTTAPRGLDTLVGSVVRLTKRSILGHAEGTRALIVSTRDSGRFPYELLVPGYPIKFWVRRDDVEIINAPARNGWDLLEGVDG